jgi:hypothetical protein
MVTGFAVAVGEDAGATVVLAMAEEVAGAVEEDVVPPEQALTAMIAIKVTTNRNINNSFFIFTLFDFIFNNLNHGRHVIYIFGGNQSPPLVAHFIVLLT